MRSSWGWFAALLAVVVAASAAVPAAAEDYSGSPRHFELHTVREYHVTAPTVLHERAERRHPTLASDRAESGPFGATLTRASGRVHTELPSFALTAFGELLELELQRNDELLSPSFRFLVDTKEEPFEFENCYYQGRVRGRPDSAVAVSTCGGGLDGLIVAGGTHYVIQPASHFGGHATLGDVHAKAARGAPRRSLEQGLAGDTPAGVPLDESRLAPHVIYRTSDTSTQGFVCSDAGHQIADDILASAASQVSAGSHDHDHDHDHRQGGEQKAVRPLANGPYYIEMLVVSDMKEVAFWGNATATTKIVIELVNGVQTLLSRLPSNTIGTVVAKLVAVDNWSAQSQLKVNGVVPSLSTGMPDYLDAFITWSNELRTRGVQFGGVPNDNAHLITGWNLDSTTSGRGSTGSMCQARSAAISEDLSEGRGQSKVFTFQTMAHELGHNLGSNHDGVGNNCTVGFLMDASMSPTFAVNSSLQWSACSSDSVRSLLQSLDAGSNCLLNSPAAVVGSGPVCGDFILAPGEQCEPSLNPTLCFPNCTFREGVVCAGGPCCTASGRFRGAGENCHGDVFSCDLTDRCDGSSAACPTNNYRPDATPCTAEGGAGAFCAGGVCWGLEKQCAVFGLVSSGCGVNSCGTLLCRTSPASSCLEVRDATGVLVAVQTGTSCAADGSKVCRGFSCVARNSSATPCAGGCGTHGECAHTGVCVCQDGYTGALCDQLQPCAVNCSALFREECVSGISALCGRCLENRTTSLLDGDDPNAPCVLLLPGVSRTVDSIGTISTSDPSLAFDKNIYSKWAACIPSASALPAQACTDYPLLSSHYASAFTMLSYSIVAADDHADADPASWAVYGANDRNGPWTLLDSRSGVLFSSRFQMRTFTTQSPGPYSSYRVNVLSVASSASTVVQVAELEYYSRAADGSTAPPPGGSGSESSGGNGGAVAAAVIIPLLIVGAAVAGGWYYYRRRKAEDAAASWTWHASPATATGTASSHVADAPSLFVAQPAPTAAPLPSGWSEHVTDEGHTYYYSEATGESVWERPV